VLLFLDIDGVMVPAKSWQSPELLNDGFPAFTKKAVKVLQNLISDDTTVMLTTSHKSRFTLEQWKEIFQKRGLQVSKLKSLDENIKFQSRKDEILNWFNLNKITEEFIIIDDDKSLNGLPPYLKDKLILTSPLIGLTDSHLDQINAILSQKPYMA
jgi:16S rRNA C1402 (ribose-2'-O) methylase RsmI